MHAKAGVVSACSYTQEGPSSATGWEPSFRMAPMGPTSADRDAATHVAPALQVAQVDGASSLELTQRVIQVRSLWQQLHSGPVDGLPMMPASRRGVSMS